MMEGAPVKRFRLLKVELRATFVEDDGERLVERPSQPMVLTAEEWPAIVERLEADRAEYERALNEGAD